MVQTLVAQPSGVLKNYVRGYELREFDTLGQEMTKPVHAYHETLISLFLNGNLNSFDTFADQSPACTISKYSKPFCSIMGIQSFMRGSFVFKGPYKIFNIQFKPTGFSNIFHVPSSVIMDKMYDTDDACYRGIKELHEQLHNSKNILEMVAFADAFLFKKFLSKKGNYNSHRIVKASEILLNQPGSFSIEQLAYHTNLSLKTFERKFIEQVGLAPKLFERIRRFNISLDMKMHQPKLSWTNICHQTGYYDQMHFIKDFTAFAGKPPSAFFKNTPPPSEIISTI